MLSSERTGTGTSRPARPPEDHDTVRVSAGPGVFAPVDPRYSSRVFVFPRHFRRRHRLGPCSPRRPSQNCRHHRTFTQQSVLYIGVGQAGQEHDHEMAAALVYGAVYPNPRRGGLRGGSPPSGGGSLQDEAGDLGGGSAPRAFLEGPVTGPFWVCFQAQRGRKPPEHRRTLKYYSCVFPLPLCALESLSLFDVFFVL